MMTSLVLLAGHHALINASGASNLAVSAAASNSLFLHCVLALSDIIENTNLMRKCVIYNEQSSCIGYTIVSSYRIVTTIKEAIGIARFVLVLVETVSR